MNSIELSEAEKLKLYDELATLSTELSAHKKLLSDAEKVDKLKRVKEIQELLLPNIQPL